ncbi:sulfatase [Neiella marina]|nr:sulfatase [Neiella marina]
MKNLLAGLFAALAVTACSSSQQATSNNDNKVQRPHILFIAIDDMRADVGSFGVDYAITPNLDAVAQRGVRFERAYVQQPICGPSRASLMTGARPDTLGVTHNYVHFRDNIPDILTLPQHFMNNGYETMYFGKVFHGHNSIQKDDAHSWSRQPVSIPGLKKPVRYAIQQNTDIQAANKKVMFAKYGQQAKFGLGSGPAYERADVSDNTYPDGHSTDLAIATLNDALQTTDKPLFIGLGFHKPHLPWVAPAKYWDMYDPADIPLAEYDTAPQGGAAMGLHASFELRTFYGIPKQGPLDDELARTLKHAYLASISYVDAQIGRMIEAIDKAGIADNTIIMIWSDHGWHLGDMGVWGKATNYEIATRVPLIVVTPDMTASVTGTSSKALVELVDMYPTLTELAGLPLPEHLEGQSFVPLLSQPDQPWKAAVFSQFPNSALREWGAFPLRPGMRETYFGPLITEVEGRIQQQFPERWDRELFEHYLMGYAMRTERYRLIVYLDTRDEQQQPLFVELYDHQTDPNETINIAEQKPKLTARLIKQFQAGWQGNLAK